MNRIRVFISIIVASVLVFSAGSLASAESPLEFSRDTIAKQGTWILSLGDFTTKLANNIMSAYPEKIDVAELILDNSEYLTGLGQEMVNRENNFSTAESVQALGEALTRFAGSLELARSIEVGTTTGEQASLAQLGAVTDSLGKVGENLVLIGTDTQERGGSLDLESYRKQIQHLIFIFTAFQNIQAGMKEDQSISATIATNQASESENTTHQMILFDASNSIDTGGTIDSETGFFWDFGDGSFGHGPFVSHAYSTPNTYRVKLMINGQSGFFMESTTVKIAPVYPVAAITTNLESGVGPHPDTLTVHTDEGILFSGGASFDPAGATDELVYEWDFGDGTIDTGDDNRDVYHAFTTPGTFEVRLKVDNGTLSDFDTKKFTVLPPGPEAVILLRSASSNTWEPAEKQFYSDVFIEPFTLSLSAKNSLGSPLTDSERSPLVSYHWEFGDGTSQDQTATQIAAGQTITHVYKEPDNYILTLTVTDGGSLTDTMEKIIQLAPSGTPVADFTASTWTAIGTDTILELDGTSSFTNRTIQSYVWEIRDQNRSVIRTEVGARMNHRFTLPGQFEISLTVMDTAGTASARVTQRFMITTNPPVADFEFSMEPGNPNTVYFNASESYDADKDDSLSYSWDFNNDGIFEITRSEDPETSRVIDTIGDNTVTLEVSDQFNARDRTTKVVPITSTLVAELTIPEKSKTIGVAPLDVSVIGSGFYNLRTGRDYNEVQYYAWDFGDGSTPSVKSNVTEHFDRLEHTYIMPGEYPLTLTVKDRNGKIATASTMIYVGDGASPIAVIDVVPSTTAVSSTKTTFVFDAGRSVNSRGTTSNLSLSWDFGDKSPIETGTTAKHAFSKVGVYSVTLSVVDAASKRIDKSTIRITITDQPTVVRFTAAPLAGSAPLTVTVDATASQNPDGSIIEYRWDFGDGSIERSASNPKNTHTYKTPGVYDIVLTVTDESRVKVISNPVIITVK